MTYDPYSRSMQENPYPSYEVLGNESPCAHKLPMDVTSALLGIHVRGFATVPIRFGSRGSR